MKEVDENIITSLKEILLQILPVKIKIAKQSLYKNYKEFIKAFTRKGGIIEAKPNVHYSKLSSPSISFLIEPNGEIQLLGSYDKITCKEYTNFASLYPSESLPRINFNALAQTIGKELYKKEIFGYITLDMLAYPDPQDEQNHPLFWVLGIDCFLNNYICSYFYFDFIVNGKYDEENDQYLIQKGDLSVTNRSINVSHNESQQNRSTVTTVRTAKQAQRCFLYIPILYNEQLTNLHSQTFFHMCKVAQLQYDIPKKMGTTFFLLDSLQSGTLGLIIINSTRENLISIANSIFNFLVKMIGKPSLNYLQLHENQVERYDENNFNQMVGKIKLLSKKSSKNTIQSQKKLNTMNSQYI